MKVLFDTNVIIDALTERDYDYRPSQKLIRYVISGSVKGYISAKQLSDIYIISLGNIALTRNKGEPLSK